MSRFHSTRARSEATHKNFMGGASHWILDPITRLRVAASSCFFGEPQYYRRDEKDTRPSRHAMPVSNQDMRRLRQLLGALEPTEWSGVTPAERMEMAIDAALDFDVERTLQEAVRLRTEAYIRTTPQVILVRAANHAKAKGTGLVRKYAPTIIARADEPSVGLAYQLWRYGKPIPNSLKKAWRDALQGAKVYHLAKYRMDSRVVKTVDVVNLVHAKSDAVDSLSKRNLKQNGTTWESILSGRGANKNSWRRALPVMGHMALLRNLRNLMSSGVSTQKIVAQLRNGAKTGKQLPFRYYSAYRALKTAGVAPGVVLDAVEECLMLSLKNLPTFRGRVMSLCDNSGSARGAATSSMGTMQISTIANLQAVLTGMVSEDGHVGVFGDKLDTFAIRPNSSVFDQLEHAEEKGKRVGAATENGVWLFWNEAIRSRQRWDHVFVYSDMQAGHGGLFGKSPVDYAQFTWGTRHIDVAKLVAEYRRQVNPKVHVHLVQVAGYQDTLMPEHYDRTTILGGWGDGLLRFAAEMAHLRDGDDAVTLAV